MSMTTWFRQAGIELTRLLPKIGVSAFERKFSSLGGPRHDFLSLRNRVKGWGYDCDCVEVSSLILRSWEQAEEFYHMVATPIEAIGGRVYDPNQCGTGGHIHVGVSQEEGDRIVRLSANHPWILMAFAHPSDSYNTLPNGYASSWDRLSECYKARALEFRIGYSTVEFRAFDLAQTWGMQEEHMAFAQAFTRYALSEKSQGENPLIMTREQVGKLTLSQCLTGFEKLIHKLELPWSRYKWYQGNIRTRREQGTPNF